MFGAEPERLAEAARAVINWVRPDFLDLQIRLPGEQGRLQERGFVSAEGPSAAGAGGEFCVARAAHPVPATAKIRIGWDDRSINAVQRARILEQSGCVASRCTVGTKAQGYSGYADWSVIGEVAAAVEIPGDRQRRHHQCRRRLSVDAKRVSPGLMVGRAAMASPYFSQIRASLDAIVLLLLRHWRTSGG